MYQYADAKVTFIMTNVHVGSVIVVLTLIIVITTIN